MWSTPPSKLVLNKKDVHIWCAKTDFSTPPNTSLFSTLSIQEKLRADRFKFSNDRLTFITARGILRSLLGKYLQKHPAKISFRFGEFGKPKLSENTSLQFNISHSENLVIFGFAKNQSIGVDVEFIKEGVELLDIAKRFFSTNEFKTMSSLADSEQKLAFFNCWTRKEAFIKAIGDGLSFPLDQFEVSLRPNEPAKMLATHWNPNETSKWSLYSFNPQKDYVAAIAIKNQIEKIKYWRYK